jgi:hypothetical protein
MKRVNCVKRGKVGIGTARNFNDPPKIIRGIEYVETTTVKIATDWTIRDRILVGARFSALVQTGAGANSASFTMGTESLSRG